MMHFWYSAEMIENQDDYSKSRGLPPDELNRCIVLFNSEKIELEYSHCHTVYIQDGLSKHELNDIVYLGEGEISFIGKKPSLDYLEQQ